MVTTAAVAQAITVIFYRAETGTEEGSKDIASMAKLLKKNLSQNSNPVDFHLYICHNMTIPIVKGN